MISLFFIIATVPGHTHLRYGFHTPTIEMTSIFVIYV